MTDRDLAALIADARGAWTEFLADRDGHRSNAASSREQKRGDSAKYERYTSAEREAVAAVRSLIREGRILP